MSVAPIRIPTRASSSTKVKICGVTNTKDALFICKQGADFMGMIMWPKAKRSVSWDVAKEMCSIAKASETSNRLCAQRKSTHVPTFFHSYSTYLDIFNT